MVSPGSYSVAPRSGAKPCAAEAAPHPASTFGSGALLHPFNLSKHWKNPDTWDELDIANFLRASRTMDGQAQKFPRNQKWLKQFPTVESVLEWSHAEEERQAARGSKGPTTPSHKWTTEPPASVDGTECCSVCGIGRSASNGIPCEEPLTVGKAFEIDEDNTTASFPAMVDRLVEEAEEPVSDLLNRLGHKMN